MTAYAIIKEHNEVKPQTAPLEMTVLSMNDFPIGVYTSEKEAKQAIQEIYKAIREGKSRYCADYPNYCQTDKEKEDWIKVRFYLHTRTFGINEIPAC